MSKHPIRGGIYALISALFFASMGVFVKFAEEVPNETLVFFRNLICLAAVIPFIIHDKVSLKTTRFPLHFSRAVFGLVNIYCYFFTLRHLFLTNAIVLLNTIPLFIPLVILLWNRKKIPRLRTYALALGFLGILLILKPGARIVNVASLIGIGGAMAGAIGVVALRKLSKTDDTRLILFYYFLISVVVSFFPMIVAWQPIVSKEMWYIIGIIGLSAYGYQFCLTKAYKNVSASRAGALLYMAVIFGGFYDWLIWGSIPDYWTLIGCSLIAAGGIWTILDQNHSQRIE